MYYDNGFKQMGEILIEWQIICAVYAPNGSRLFNQMT